MRTKTKKESTLRPVSIVVLSKYIDIFMPFLESLRQFQPNILVHCVVDGSSHEDVVKWLGALEPQVFPILGPKKFSMAGNANLGLKAVPQDHDILYCGDDIRFLDADVTERLQKIAYSDDKIGILSPKLIGRGSPAQTNPPEGVSFARPLELWFPCVYIKREVIQKIGYLDELFNDFGSDDLDFCIRAKKAGYQLAVTSEVSVQHEASQEGGPTTFVKNIGIVGWQMQQTQAMVKLRQKYGVDERTFQKFLHTGDVACLEKTEAPAIVSPSKGKPLTNDEGIAYLKTRSIYIATPCYGNMAAINYIQSLNALVNLCDLHNILYTISLVGNESLISRARNAMVDGFLKNPLKCTDFFFIDADIGFNPKDIITLLFHPEEIVAAACPKKSLRLDRVFEAGKNNGRQYTASDLQNLTGDFVLNFGPATGRPDTINLGQMLEVRDAGTGLMRIKREVFEKFQVAYPDRWFWPSRGEPVEHGLPMFEYFQVRRDVETASENPGGYPIYLSEDYAFCRDSIKAGMKVHVAPWIITSHMGSYEFRGNMEAVALSGGRLLS